MSVICNYLHLHHVTYNFNKITIIFLSASNRKYNTPKYTIEYLQKFNVVYSVPAAGNLNAQLACRQSVT